MSVAGASSATHIRDLPEHEVRRRGLRGKEESMMEWRETRERILTRSWQAVEMLRVGSLGVNRGGVGHLSGLHGSLGSA